MYGITYYIIVRITLIIQACATIKINIIKFNVVCTLIVPHCGTNQAQGCDINRGNMVCVIILQLFERL